MSHIILQRSTTVVRHLPTSIDTPYKHAIFLDQTWLSRENHGCWCTNTSSWDGEYAEYQTTTPNPKLTCDGSHDRTFTIRSVTLTHAPSSDHLITRTILSLYRTTLAFVAQRTHQDARHIARSITYHSLHNGWILSLQNVRAFVRTFFFHANIHKTDCEFLRLNDILVASDRATIAKGSLIIYFTGWVVIETHSHLHEWNSMGSVSSKKTKVYGQT